MDDSELVVPEVKPFNSTDVAFAQGMIVHHGQAIGGMNQDMHSTSGMSMSGMVTDGEMGDFRTMSGATSDRRFIDMMIRHHEGAVQMAEQVVPDGEDPRVSELAQTITRHFPAGVVVPPPLEWSLRVKHAGPCRTTRRAGSAADLYPSRK